MLAGLGIKIEVVMIQALCLDPLEFHRIVPAKGRMRFWCFVKAQNAVEKWRTRVWVRVLTKMQHEERECQRSNS